MPSKKFICTSVVVVSLLAWPVAATEPCHPPTGADHQALMEILDRLARGEISKAEARELKKALNVCSTEPPASEAGED